MDFNKQTLLNLMSYPNDISEKEEAELMEVISNYPYFQLGYSMLAKAKHDKNTSDAYAFLSKAAIYASNRRILKEIFYEDLHIDPTSIASADHAEEEANTFQDTESFQDHSIPEENSFHTPEAYSPPSEADEDELDQNSDNEVIQSDEVYNELEENLRKLRESKNKFSEEEAEHKKKIADDYIQDNSAKLESEDAVNKHSEENNSFLLDQISDQDVVNDTFDTGQKQQNELIDKFINSQDSISFKIKPTAETEEEAIDLSHQSTEVTDNLISENLAEIYVKQGKKEKAIEIYQKLIWKLPEKKAYFADKIESLKAE